MLQVDFGFRNFDFGIIIPYKEVWLVLDKSGKVIVVLGAAENGVEKLSIRNK